jgi:hypothetical protein
VPEVVLGAEVASEVASELEPELELEVRLADDSEGAIAFEHRRRLETALPGMIVPKLTVVEACPGVPTPVREALETMLATVLQLEIVVAIGVVDTTVSELPEPLDTALVGELMLVTIVVIDGVDVPILPLPFPLHPPATDVPLT